MRYYLLLFLSVVHMNKDILGKKEDTLYIHTLTDIPTCPAERPVITIWIHGSKLFFSKFIPLFSHCPKGLSKAIELEPKYHHRTIANTLIEHGPHQFLEPHFYLFGWSGKLSFGTRTRAAQKLYEQLKALMQEYQSLHPRPFIRIITHSHGGNVALNVTNFITPEDNILIDELILLACPVQEATKHAVLSPYFAKVISLYSKLDSVQVLDPQGLYKQKTETKKPLFSQRVFPSASHIHQIRVKLNGRGLFHLEFLMPKFLKALPTLLHTIHTSPLYQSDKITTISIRL